MVKERQEVELISHHHDQGEPDTNNLISGTSLDRVSYIEMEQLR